ncbi:MAG: hypothetical protein UV17_C0020G0011 [Candidatus Gottesmanbacteria bacterium GW2011_GWA1_42_26]|nr:MAG: hypothetical protein UV17_C0020G0011 [Candidatus Gottesmanbacteria bacterium GW2011_GWA1_42_26]
MAKKDYTNWDRNDLIKEIEQLRKRKKFGLVWENKPEDVVELCKKELPVLAEVKEKEIFKSSELSINLLIEGDNYHSLSVLNYTHKGKVDVIYIDPPYNTGNKDFIYNDQYVDKEDPYRHTKWLSFMNKRLTLAKELLSSNGVIFISIDDNEYAHLKLLCDEIFGENNSIGPLIQNKLNSKNDTQNIQKNHEYVLVYRKKEIKKEGKTVATLINKKLDSKEVFKENESFYFTGDPITTRGDGGILNARKNLGYTIYYNPDTNDIKGVMDYDIELAKSSNNEEEVYTDKAVLIDQGYVLIRPPRVRGKLGAWTWDCKRFNTNIDEIKIKKNRNGGYIVCKKNFVDPDDVYEVDGKYYFDMNKFGNSKSIIEYSTNEGTDAYNQILEPGSFNNPKNVEMLKHFLSLYDNKNSLVLDFFAGSGTLAQAVLELNKEDKGLRRFILCTNNENGIAEKICYKRVFNVINGYDSIDGIQSNLKYFKTSFVPADPTDKNKNTLTQKATEMLCIKEDAFEKVKIEENYKIFRNRKRYTGIVFDHLAIPEFKRVISDIDGHFNVYVFSLGDDTFDEEFTDIKNKVKLSPIPEAILRVYRRIFK